MSTKSKYVKKFVEDAKQNPRKALYGHGIPSAIMNIIAERQDILAKLGVIAFNSSARTKYSNGLRPSKDFKIFAYKNFATFNVKARADIEEFVNGMTEENQASFKNNKNIIVIVAQPDNEIVDDDGAQIVSGPSLFIPFDRAVRADQKTISGYYIMVAYSDSFMNTSESEKEPTIVVNTTTAKQNETLTKKKAIKARNIDGKIKTAAAKKRQLMSRKEQLSNQLMGMNMQEQQLAAIFGEDYMAGVAAMDAKDAKTFTKDIKKLMKSSSAKDKEIVKSILSLKAAGAKASDIRHLLKYIENDTLATMIETGESMSGSETINKRRRDLYNQLKKERAKAEKYLAAIETARKEGDRRALVNAQVGLRRTNARIQVLRGKLQTYTKMSDKARSKKTEMLNKVNARIEKLLAKGTNLGSAIDIALDESPATESEKQLIKQQVLHEVADGAIAQYAIQQAIQDNVNDEVDEKTGIKMSDLFGKL